MNENQEGKPESIEEKEPEFMKFNSRGGDIVATFLDEDGQHTFSLGYDELSDKIANLKKEGLPFTKQKEILEHWNSRARLEAIPD